MQRSLIFSIIAVILIVLVAVLTGCSPQSQADLNVVTSTSIIANI